MKQAIPAAQAVSRGMSDPCRALMSMVLMQAIKDAYGLSTDSRALAECAKARAWFRDAGPDFRQTCEAIDLDPMEIRRRVISGDFDLEALKPSARATARLRG